MNDLKVSRITGLFGIACVALTFGQSPLWLVGSAPSVYDGRGLAQHLFDIMTVAFTRILMDLGIYVSMLVFARDLDPTRRNRWPRAVPIRAAIASGHIPPVPATPVVRSANRGGR